MANLTREFLSQLDIAIDAFGELLQKSNFDDLSDLGGADHQRVITMCRAAVERAAGPSSPYTRQISELMRRQTAEGNRVAMVAGVAQALRSDLAAGNLQGAAALHHAEVLGDILEGASELLARGHLDAAAVVAGSALEAHLRRLCARHGVAIESPGDPRSSSKDAALLNADLAFAYVYEPLDQKNVASWLEIREQGVEREGRDRASDSISLQIQGIRDFITRNPA